MTKYTDKYEIFNSLKNLKKIVVKTDSIDINISRCSEDNYYISIKYDKPVYFIEESIFKNTMIEEVNDTITYRLESNTLIDHKISDAVIDICIPDSLKLVIDTKSSNIIGKNFNSEIVIHNHEGDITLENIGKGQIISNFGNVNLKNVFGNFDIKNVNGNVFIERTVGAVLSISTIQSDVKLIDLSYNHITCKNESGNTLIDLSGNRVNHLEVLSKFGNISFIISNNSSESVELKTDLGDITIYVPDNLVLNYDLSTNNGEISTNIDADNAFEEIIDTNRFCVNFNPEVTYIRACSKDGNVNVLENKSGIKGECLDIEKEATKKYRQDMSGDLIETIIEIEDSIISNNNDEQRFKEKYQKVFDATFEENIAEINSNNIHNSKSNLKKIYHLFSWFKKDKNDKHDEKNQKVIKILEMVEQNKISVEDAGKLIKSVTYKE